MRKALFKRLLAGKNMSDLLLWNRLRQGNKEALETIYRTYYSILNQYGQRFTNDLSSVEDSIQELFVELWNSRERLSETDAIKPYLLLSLKRKIIRSTQKIRKSTDVELEEYHFDAVLDIEAIIVDGEDMAERKQKLQIAFSELSDRQKEIVYLKYYADLDYDAIAKQMDLNYQSARNLLHRAITKLSKHIELILLFLILTEYIGSFMSFY